MRMCGAIFSAERFSALACTSTHDLPTSSSLLEDSHHVDRRISLGGVGYPSPKGNPAINVVCAQTYAPKDHGACVDLWCA